MIKNKQRGFMVVSAIILSVVVGLMAATIAYLYTTGGRSSANQVMTTQALYIAQAGIEHALNNLVSRTLSSRVSCTSAGIASTSFGQGEYTVTATSYVPTQTTLSAAITSSSTIIPVNSVSSYAPSGTIIIDDEFIDYGSVGTSASACSPSAAPCFLAAVRGQGGTTAASHTISTRLRQNLCQIASTGAVTSGATILASRTITENVQFAMPVFVGNLSSGELISTWDGHQWVRQTASGGIEDENLHGLSVVDFWEGKGGGESMAAAVCGGSLKSFFISFNAATLVWDQMTCAQNTNLNINVRDVDCLNANYCKAVGLDAGFGGWNGSTWARDSKAEAGPNRIPATSVVQGVSCLSTSACFAVGDSQAGELIISWDGTIWGRASDTAIANNVDLKAITCLAGPFCVTVGTSGTFGHYNGSWSVPSTSVPSVTFNDVYCISSSDCWAVGDASGGAVFVHWDGSSWTRNTGLIGTAPSVSMNSVYCADTDNCWAVGALGGAFWNGVTWADASTGLTSFTANKVSWRRGGPPDRAFGWQEVFN